MKCNFSPLILFSEVYLEIDRNVIAIYDELITFRLYKRFL